MDLEMGEGEKPQVNNEPIASLVVESSAGKK